MCTFRIKICFIVCKLQRGVFCFVHRLYFWEFKEFSDFFFAANFIKTDYILSKVIGFQMFISFLITIEKKFSFLCYKIEEEKCTLNFRDLKLLLAIISNFTFLKHPLMSFYDYV